MERKCFGAGWVFAGSFASLSTAGVSQSSAGERIYRIAELRCVRQKDQALLKGVATEINAVAYDGKTLIFVGISFLGISYKIISNTVGLLGP